MSRAQPLFYFALVTRKGPDWVVTFPDLPWVQTTGTSFWHALARAEEALDASLAAGLESGLPLPVPSDFQSQPGHFPIPVRRSILEAYARKESSL